jgi:hypothetical protein
MTVPTVCSAPLQASAKPKKLRVHPLRWHSFCEIVIVARHRVCGCFVVRDSPSVCLLRPSGGFCVDFNAPSQPGTTLVHCSPLASKQQQWHHHHQQLAAPLRTSLRLDQGTTTESTSSGWIVVGRSPTLSALHQVCHVTCVLSTLCNAMEMQRVSTSTHLPPLPKIRQTSISRPSVCPWRRAICLPGHVPTPSLACTCVA